MIVAALTVGWHGSVLLESPCLLCCLLAMEPILVLLDVVPTFKDVPELFSWRLEARIAVIWVRLAPWGQSAFLDADDGVWSSD